MDNLVVICENEHIFHSNCIDKRKQEEKMECPYCSCSMMLVDDDEGGSLLADKSPAKRRSNGLSPKKGMSVTFSCDVKEGKTVDSPDDTFSKKFK